MISVLLIVGVKSSYFAQALRIICQDDNFSPRPESFTMICQKDISGYLSNLLSKKPLLRREWDEDDLYQELYIKFLQKIPKETLESMSQEHVSSLSKLMAKQIATDKLRNMQRGKRDCRKLVSLKSEPGSFLGADPLSDICQKEQLEELRSKIDDESWRILCMRNEGESWEKITKEIAASKNPSAIRMRFMRTLKKISKS